MWRTRPAQRLSGCTHARPGALLALLIRLGSRSTPAPLCTCPSLPRPPHGLPFVCGATGTFSGPAPPACTIAIPVRFQWPEAHQRPSRRHLSAPASLSLPFPQLAFDSSHPAPPIGQLCNLHFVRSAARGCAARCGGPALPAAYPLSPLNCHRALSTTPVLSQSSPQTRPLKKWRALLRSAAGAAPCARCSRGSAAISTGRSSEAALQAQLGGPPSLACVRPLRALPPAPRSSSSKAHKSARWALRRWPPPALPPWQRMCSRLAASTCCFLWTSGRTRRCLARTGTRRCSGCWQASQTDTSLRVILGFAATCVIDACAASAPPQPCSEDQHLPPTCRQAGQRRGHRCGAGGLGGSGCRRAAAHPTCLAAPAPHAGHLSSGVPAGGRQHQARRYTVGGGHEGRLAPCAPLGSAPHLCVPQVCWLCVAAGLLRRLPACLC